VEAAAELRVDIDEVGWREAVRVRASNVGGSFAASAVQS